jgi:hypothetical protein
MVGRIAAAQMKIPKVIYILHSGISNGTNVVAGGNPHEEF